MKRDQRFVVQLPFQWSLKGMRDCWGAGSFFVIKSMLTFFNFGLTKPSFRMSGKWPLLSERFTMLEMVGKSSLMQSLTILVGIESLSQVLFGAFSSSFLIPSWVNDTFMNKWMYMNSHEYFGHWWEIPFSRKLPRNKNAPWRQTTVWRHGGHHRICTSRADKGWAVKRARPSKKVWCSGLGLCLEMSLVFDFSPGLRCGLSIRHCRCHWIMAAWFVFLHFFLVPLCWYALSERQMLLFFPGSLIGIDKRLFQRVPLITSMILPLNYIFVLLLAIVVVIPKQKQLSAV